MGSSAGRKANSLVIPSEVGLFWKRKVPPSYSAADESAASLDGRRDDDLIVVPA